MSEGKKTWLLGAALLALTLAVYACSFGNGFVWQDDKFVYENALLAQRGFVGLYAIWFESGATPQYSPLVFTSYWIEYRLWGLDPTGYHIVSVLLHAASAMLIWRVLVRMKVHGAWMIAAVFAVHPVMVESVAWAAERKNVLSLLFYAASLRCWMSYCPLGEDRRTSRRRWGWYGASILFFIAALLSNVMTCTLPAAIALLIFWKRKAVNWRDAVTLLPFFVIGVLTGLQAAMLARHYVYAGGEEWSLDFLDRSLIAGNAAAFYASKLVLPIDLMFIYPRWDVRAHGDVYFFAPAFVIALTVGLAMAHKRFGLGPLTAWLFFLGTLFPVLGFFNVPSFQYSFVADHSQYHASIGVIALVVGSVAAMLRSVCRDRARNVPAMVGVSTLLVLGVAAAMQTRAYRDPQSLWEAAIAKNPEAWIAHNKLGLIYLRQVDLERAHERFVEAARLAPDVVETRMNLGTVLLDLDRPAHASREFRAAISLEPRTPESYLLLGAAQRRLGQPQAAFENFALAREIYKRILGQKGSGLSAWYGLGRAEQGMEDHDAAIKSLGIVLAGQRDPELRAEVLCAMAMSHLVAGRDEMAVASLEKALRESPDHFDASLRLAQVLASSQSDTVRNGRRALSIAHGLRMRVGLTSPRYVLCLRAVAAAHAELGNFESAEDTAIRGVNLAKQRRLETLPAMFAARTELFREKKPLRLTGTQWVW